MTGYLDSPPLALAHRGGSGTAGNAGIENSLAAFAHAYELGYRYLETDVRATSDGVVYAVHDAALDRLAGSAETVAGLTAEALDLQRLDQREPFARLAALYKDLPDAHLNIDLKSEDVVEPTCALVRELGVTQRTLLASFSHRRLRRARRLLPGVATSASAPEVALVKLVPTPLLRLLRLAPVCLQVPLRRGPVTVVTDGFIRKAHALGLQVHVWTVDDPAEMRRLLDLGVDGIITDRTDLLKDVLVERGTWKEPS
ncbi:glycerophosphodiester phosphodiesterase family protein [Aeromicrobium wangtongii]|uniref:glycerophosphodiester phosphodiesterase family protein n=1 Tax=Aeromicrobium wangtongii TaxID=2969247 RepID=UPI0020181952|nr:glycerophosphodiester phosphodiesterase family protein [Aeromicrobium wangtongii]MCL3819219.1 glycerophosphodiester phosphodiesterase [Aeromicrobium wangtongii]